MKDSSAPPSGAHSGIDLLWAPWRLDYVKGDRSPGCPFCTLPQEGESEETLVLYCDNDLSIIMNKFPYNPGHLLVIPRAHVADPSQLDPVVWAKLGRAIQIVLEILQSDPKPQGFNLGMNIGAAGGAGIPQHLHWHILPRWAGDTNFMPLLAETKSIAAHNATIYRRLKPLFESFSSRLK